MKKNILRFTVLMLSLFILSCTNSINTGFENSSFVTIRISSANSIRAVAVPDMEKLNISRYVFRISGNGTEKSEELAGGLTELNLELSYGVSWNITVEAYNAEDKCVLKGSHDNFVPSENNKSVTIQIMPYQIFENSATGTAAVTGGINLHMKFPPNTNGYEFQWYCDDLAGDGGQKKSIPKEGADYNFVLTGIKPGSKKLTIDVFNLDYSASQKKTIVKNIMIYSNLISDCWLDASVKKSEITLSGEEIVPENFNNYFFYINGTGGTLNNSFFTSSEPEKTPVEVDSVQKAVSIIEKLDPNGIDEHSIYISGTVTLSSSGINNSMVYFGGTSPEKVKSNIKLIGIGENPTLDANGTLTSCRVLYVNTLGKITLENLTLTKGNISGSGGGLYHESGEVSLKDVNILINISAGSGGGIYICNDAIFSMENGSISVNVATINGGGITSYARVGNRKDENGKNLTNAYLKNVSITSNSITSGNGGGIYITSTNNLSLDSCTVNNNIGTNGPNIYVVGALYLRGAVNFNDDVNSGIMLYYAKETANKNIGLVNIIGNVSPVSGKTKIGKIQINDIAEAAENSKVIFKDNVTEEIVSYFDFENLYSVSTESGTKGQIIALAETSGGSAFADHSFVFTIPDDCKNYSYDGTEKNPEISVKIDGVEKGIAKSSLISDINAELYCGISKMESAVFDSVTGKILLPSSLTPDIYQLVISGTYDHIPFSETITITISE